MFRSRAFAALVGLALLSPLPAFASGWEEIYTDRGVTVSRKAVEGSKFVAFKGDTVYDVEIGKVVYVLLDNDHRLEWVDRLYLNRVIEQIGPYEYVLYQAFQLPPPFANRDYVYHAKARRDPATGAITLDIQSTTHPEAPETVGVRAELVNSRYVLTPVGPSQTRVEVEIVTDPKGWMPAWLVNLIQKSWPLETLDGIRGQLAKPYTGVAKLPGEAAPAPIEPTPGPEAGGGGGQPIEPVDEPVAQ